MKFHVFFQQFSFIAGDRNVIQMIGRLSEYLRPWQNAVYRIKKFLTICKVLLTTATDPVVRPIMNRAIHIKIGEVVNNIIH